VLATDSQGREWSITRTRKPFTLKILRNGVPLEAENPQLALEDALYGYRTFRNAVVFDRVDRFEGADQADQLRMLDEIQGLDLRGAFRRAKDWRDQASFDLKGATDREAVITQRLIDLETQQTELLRALQTFSQDKLEAVAAANAESRIAKARVGLLTEQLKQRESQAHNIPELTAALEQAEIIERALTDSQREATRVQAILAGIKSERQRLVHALDVLHDSGRCPTCRQITDQRIDANFSGDLKDLDAREHQAQHEWTQIQKNHAKLRNKLKVSVLECRTRLADTQAQAGELVLLQLRESRAEAEEQHKRGVERARQAMSMQFNNQDLLDANASLIQRLRSEQTTYTRRQAKLALTLTVAEYWVEAFGDYGIRSLLFDSVADFINERMREHLIDLAGGEANVLLSAQTALKRGGTKERISITSEWTWGGKGKGAPSPGQDQRQVLALFAALQDVAERRSARPFSLRIYDEPADALDARGIEMFAAWVRKQARRMGTAFLITHNPTVTSMVEADQVWTVVMDENGSRIVRDKDA